MRYTIYQTDSIEELKNEIVIGGEDSPTEVNRAISDFLAVNHFHTDPYWRYLAGEKATFIDYGSWSKFIAVVPPLPLDF